MLDANIFYSGKSFAYSSCFIRGSIVDYDHFDVMTGSLRAVHGPGQEMRAAVGGDDNAGPWI